MGFSLGIAMGGFADGLKSGTDIANKNARTKEIQRRTDLAEAASARAEERQAAWAEDRKAEAEYLRDLTLGSKQAGVDTAVVDRTASAVGTDTASKPAPVAQKSALGGPPVQTAAVDSGATSDAPPVGFGAAAAEAENNVTAHEPVESVPSLATPADPNEAPLKDVVQAPSQVQVIPDHVTGVPTTRPGSVPLGFYRKQMVKAARSGSLAKMKYARKYYEKAQKEQETWAKSQLDNELKRQTIAGKKIANNTLRIANSAAGWKLRDQHINAVSNRIPGAMSAFEGMSDNETLSNPNTMALAGNSISALTATYKAFYPEGKVNIRAMKGGGFSVDIDDGDGNVHPTRTVKTVGELRQMSTMAYAMSSGGKPTDFFVNSNINRLVEQASEMNDSATDQAVAEADAKATKARLDAETSQAALDNDLPQSTAKLAASQNEVKQEGVERALATKAASKEVDAKNASNQATLDKQAMAEKAKLFRDKYNTWAGTKQKNTTAWVQEGVKLLENTTLLNDPSLMVDVTEWVTDVNGKPHKKTAKVNILAQAIRSKLPGAVGVVPSKTKPGTYENRPISIISHDVINTALPKMLSDGMRQGLKGDELKAFVSEKMQPFMNKYQFKLPFQRDMFMKEIFSAMPNIIGAVNADVADIKRREAANAEWLKSNPNAAARRQAMDLP